MSDIDIIPPVWPVTPVDDMPRLRLGSWRVMQTDRGERILVGRNLTEREGRVSSATVQFDAVRRTFTTQSGRVYELVGNPGYDADAEHTWRYWRDLNGVIAWHDVTEEVRAQLAAAAAGNDSGGDGDATSDR